MIGDSDLSSFHGESVGVDESSLPLPGQISPSLKDNPQGGQGFCYWNHGDHLLQENENDAFHGMKGDYEKDERGRKSWLSRIRMGMKGKNCDDARSRGNSPVVRDERMLSPEEDANHHARMLHPHHYHSPTSAPRTTSAAAAAMISNGYYSPQQMGRYIQSRPSSFHGHETDDDHFRAKSGGHPSAMLGRDPQHSELSSNSWHGQTNATMGMATDTMMMMNQYQKCGGGGDRLMSNHGWQQEQLQKGGGDLSFLWMPQQEGADDGEATALHRSFCSFPATSFYGHHGDGSNQEDLDASFSKLVNAFEDQHKQQQDGVQREERHDYEAAGTNNTNQQKTLSGEEASKTTKPSVSAGVASSSQQRTATTIREIPQVEDASLSQLDENEMYMIYGVQGEDETVSEIDENSKEGMIVTFNLFPEVVETSSSSQQQPPAQEEKKTANGEEQGHQEECCKQQQTTPVLSNNSIKKPAVARGEEKAAATTAATPAVVTTTTSGGKKPTAEEEDRTHHATESFDRDGNGSSDSHPKIITKIPSSSRRRTSTPKKQREGGDEGDHHAEQAKRDGSHTNDNSDSSAPKQAASTPPTRRRASTPKKQREGGDEGDARSTPNASNMMESTANRDSSHNNKAATSAAPSKKRASTPKKQREAAEEPLQQESPKPSRTTTKREERKERRTVEELEEMVSQLQEQVRLQEKRYHLLQQRHQQEMQQLMEKHQRRDSRKRESSRQSNERQSHHRKNERAVHHHRRASATGNRTERPSNGNRNVSSSSPRRRNTMPQSRSDYSRPSSSNQERNDDVALRTKSGLASAGKDPAATQEEPLKKSSSMRDVPTQTNKHHLAKSHSSTGNVASPNQAVKASFPQRNATIKLKMDGQIKETATTSKPQKQDRPSNKPQPQRQEGKQLTMPQYDHASSEEKLMANGSSDTFLFRRKMRNGKLLAEKSISAKPSDTMGSLVKRLQHLAEQEEAAGVCAGVLTFSMEETNALNNGEKRIMFQLKHVRSARFSKEEFAPMKACEILALTNNRPLVIDIQAHDCLAPLKSKTLLC